jgi:hypothetical protein
MLRELAVESSAHVAKGAVADFNLTPALGYALRVGNSKPKPLHGLVSAESRIARTLIRSMRERRDVALDLVDKSLVRHG